jgi:hypothetical protein
MGQKRGVVFGFVLGLCHHTVMYEQISYNIAPDFSCHSVNDLPGVGGDTADSLRSLGGRVGRERLRRGEVVASFLPGVTTAVTKLLTSEPNLGQVCNG